MVVDAVMDAAVAVVDVAGCIAVVDAVVAAVSRNSGCYCYCVAVLLLLFLLFLIVTKTSWA